jgi:hypothetical protein
MSQCIPIRLNSGSSNSSDWRQHGHVWCVRNQHTTSYSCRLGQTSSSNRQRMEAGGITLTSCGSFRIHHVALESILVTLSFT